MPKEKITPMKVVKKDDIEEAQEVTELSSEILPEKTLEEVKPKKDINPRDYSYKDGDELQIKSEDFIQLSQALDVALHEHTTEHFKELYKWVDKNNKIVKKVTEDQKKKGTVRRVMDIVKTLDNKNPEITRDYTGQLLLFTKTLMDKVHYANILNGNATLISELQQRATAEPSSDNLKVNK